MLRRIVIAAAILVSACTSNSAGGNQQASTSGARDCFLSSQVHSFNPVDGHHIRVSVGANDQYLLETQWNAYDLQYAEHIALRSSTGTICTGNGLGVEVMGGDNHQRFPISSITRVPDPAPQGS